ncbi:hypothetical protein [Pseudofrankia asymbiotica]|uniref:Uncharacterized protein n=1 Tax=Pseudofrankia asymbiotica TaxID=1834516 RepID=A0A1V2I7L9_9ACTN|nr:hypothetical protein [Pseudofrankia asymbiotica]ONH26390.1 hypothetical protein BL253_24685 [Pseudofrankia asymbiotica]
MNMLEQRYRAVLKLLPRAYRQDWEDDMVATFLAGQPESDDPDYSEVARPSWPEIGSVAALAVRLRLDLVRFRVGGAGAPARNLAWGDTVRLVAVLGLLVHAILAALVVAETLWLDGRIPGLAPPAVAAGFHLGWHELWTGGFVWIPAFAALVLGHRRVAQGLALVAASRALAAICVNAEVFVTGPPPIALRGSALVAEVLLNTAPVLAVLAGFHRDSPPVRNPTRWLAAYAALVAGALGLVVLDRHVGPFFDEPTYYTLPFLAAAVYCLAAHARRGASQGPAWAFALVLLAPVVLAAQTTTVLELSLLQSVGTTRSAATAAALAQVAAVLVISAPLAIVAGRSFRRLPPASAASTSAASTSAGPPGKQTEGHQ